MGHQHYDLQLSLEKSLNSLEIRSTSSVAVENRTFID